MNPLAVALLKTIGDDTMQTLFWLAPLLFIVATIVVKLTPTKRDDEILEKIQQLYNNHVAEVEEKKE